MDISLIWTGGRDTIESSVDLTGGSSSSHKPKYFFTLQSASKILSGKTAKSNADVEELKAAISGLLQLPNSSSTSTDTGLDESQGRVKKLNCNETDLVEGTPGCEECRRAKRQKLSEERSSYQGNSPNPSDLSEKTQSLTQLASARIEGSQEASTSHICPHHRTGMEGEAPKAYLLSSIRRYENRSHYLQQFFMLLQLWPQMSIYTSVIEWGIRVPGVPFGVEDPHEFFNQKISNS